MKRVFNNPTALVVGQYTEDRDVNAARNLKQLAAGYAESINACGV